MARPSFRKNPRLAFAVIASLSAGLFGCQASVPCVPEGPEPDVPIPPLEVAAFPPPTKVEVIPLRRQTDCLWQDGHWDAHARLIASDEWTWRPGAWVRVPEGCYYAPPHTEIEQNTPRRRLIYTRGAYYPYEPGTTCPPVEECR